MAILTYEKMYFILLNKQRQRITVYYHNDNKATDMQFEQEEKINEFFNSFPFKRGLVLQK